jgi:hypothetical protein
MEQKVDTKKILSAELQRIWTEEKFKPFCTFRPLAVTELIPNSLLFVGLNPSLNENQKLPTEDERTNPEFYTLDTEPANNHRYFKRFEDISKKVGHSWTHFDLLFNQQTDQRIISDIAYKQTNGADFIYQQLLISKALFDLVEPKIIIVNNSLAREFLGKDQVNNTKVWVDFKFEIDNEIGTYRLNGIPIFFTSMLTGQRALDIGSYERLIWHIKQVKNKLEI